jgi:probable phosphoglycerate mutase
MATIYLVRHGAHRLIDRVLCGRSDLASLSPEGVIQADRLAQFFADKAVECVQSSPRRRTRETAAPIARRQGLAVQDAEAMDELDSGEWTGVDFDTLRSDPAWQDWNARRGQTRPPGGESMGELQARVVGYLETLHASAPADTVIVTHAEPIRAAILHYRGMPLERFSEIDVAPGSITILRMRSAQIDADVIGRAVSP